MYGKYLNTRPQLVLVACNQDPASIQGLACINTLQQTQTDGSNM